MKIQSEPIVAVDEPIVLSQPLASPPKTPGWNATITDWENFRAKYTQWLTENNLPSS